MDSIICTGIRPGEEKPHPLAFELMLRAFSIPTDSALYIGDNPDKDCVGAHRAGIRFVHLLHPFTLRAGTAKHRIHHLDAFPASSCAVNQLKDDLNGQNGIPYRARLIGGDAGSFIIAEIGINHDGSLSRAVQLIDAAAEAGADAVKFRVTERTGCS